MDLLSKFNDVKVNLTDKITTTDRQFCEAQQKAYDHALEDMTSLIGLLTTAFDHQRDDLAPLNPSPYESSYLGDIQISDLGDTKKKMHNRFVEKIVHYFERTYHMELDNTAIEDALIPKLDIDWPTELQRKEYAQEMKNLHLNYSDVLERIFAQLGGFSFQEKALTELKEKCYAFAWCDGRKQVFTQKKALVSFSYGCSLSDYGHRWSLYERLKPVLKAACYFEYETLDFVPRCMQEMLFINFDEPVVEISASKLDSVKCFKNGRVDLRFTSEAYAREFAETFLGTTERSDLYA